MTPEAKFWFSPTLETAVWFVAAAVFLVVFAVSIRFLHHKLTRRKHYRELLIKIEKIGLKDRPEEEVIHDLVRQYGIHPPVSFLNQIQMYDQVAGDEIFRVEKANMPLPDRIDRIEYLYSIRLHAFADAPSVGGIDVLIGHKERQLLASVENKEEENPLEPISGGPDAGSDTEPEEESGEEESGREEREIGSSPAGEAAGEGERGEYGSDDEDSGFAQLFSTGPDQENPKPSESGKETPSGKDPPPETKET